MNITFKHLLIRHKKPLQNYYHKVQCKNGSVLSIQNSRYHLSKKTNETIMFEVTTTIPIIGWDIYRVTNPAYLNNTEEQYIYAFVPEALIQELINEFGGIQL